MNNKLQKLITLFNERKNFFNNHPDLYRFIKKTFGNKMPVGTKITITVQRTDGEMQEASFGVDEQDKKFIDALIGLINN